MYRPFRHTTGAVALLTLAVAPTTARADLFRDVAFGLGYAGFNIEGQRNVLSGGADFTINRNLVGNPLDFGAADLTMRGPVSFDFSTGGRLLSQLDASLLIDLRGNQFTGLPGYEFNVDVGGQATQIRGSLLVDADFSLNGFGFYDFSLTYSSRQNVAQDGRFANDEQTHDFDVGPINVSGNIFADALAVITQPFFDQTGNVNPFASFSGWVDLDEVIAASAEETQKRLALGADPLAVERAGLLAALPAEIAGTTFSANALPSQNSTASGSAVPEPATLALMLLAVPLVFRRNLPWLRNTQ